MLIATLSINELYNFRLQLILTWVEKIATQTKAWSYLLKTKDEKGKICKKGKELY